MRKKVSFVKFGCILDMNIEKLNRILLYSWLVIGTYQKNLAIGHLFIFSKSGGFLGFFLLHGNSLVYVEIIIFRSKFS